jgi:hypothetical protein
MARCAVLPAHLKSPALKWCEVIIKALFGDDACRINTNASAVDARG